MPGGDFSVSETVAAWFIWCVCLLIFVLAPPFYTAIDEWGRCVERALGLHSNLFSKFVTISHFLRGFKRYDRYQQVRLYIELTKNVSWASPFLPYYARKDPRDAFSYKYHDFQSNKRSHQVRKTRLTSPKSWISPGQRCCHWCWTNINRTVQILKYLL